MPSGFLGGGIGPTAIKRRGGRWYTAGGAPTPVAAYQPKGAASLAASYVNLANPGTYDAAPEVAPSFDSATGWTFNGSTQYLATNIPLEPPLIIFVALTHVPTGFFDGIIGGEVLGPYAAFDAVGHVEVGWSSDATATIDIIPASESIVIGWFVPDGAPQKVYIDGLHTESFPDRVAAAQKSMTQIGRFWENDSYLFAGTIAAIAYYDVSLTDFQIFAISAAMAAL